jgi:hypothetical protein
MRLTFKDGTVHHVPVDELPDFIAKNIDVIQLGESIRERDKLKPFVSIPYTVESCTIETVNE